MSYFSALDSGARGPRFDPGLGHFKRTINSLATHHNVWVILINLWGFMDMTVTVDEGRYVIIVNASDRAAWRLNTVVNT